VGLLIYGKENLLNKGNEAPLGSGLKEILERMKAWFQGNF